jgi:DNA-binding LytR/AlgR family response regulator
MKLTLESAQQPELEVVIRGDLNDPQVSQIIAALNAVKAISRLFLYQDDRTYLCPVADILYFESAKNHLIAHTKQGDMEAHYKLYELSDMLRGSGFIQISRGVLVNVREVLSVEPEFSGNYTAVMKSGKTPLIISRKYFKSFRDYVIKEL